MNKTVSINLGGLFFHIDENAYQKLNHYFDAIRRSLAPDGKDEIMSDIEGRIAELLTEKLKSDKQVVGLREVEEVIAIMGEPEDYKIDDEPASKQTYTYYPPGYNPVRTRKFYRDGEKARIAGVCAGIGHYFKIDPLWIRILFIISLFLSFGTSIFVYVLLWILIPKAITTTEKLEMTGEPINISNIEKKVREEIGGFTERIQNVDYDRLGTNAKNTAEKIGNGIGSAFMAIFKALAKVVGAIITIVSALTLGGLVIFLFTMLFSSAMVDTPWFEYANMANYAEVPLWIIGLLGFLTIGIPCFFIFLLGLKILANNLKPVGNITKYTLIAIWLIAVAFSVYLGIRQANATAFEGKTMTKEELMLSPEDTLYIKFRYNDYFAKTIDHNTAFKITQDADENDILYSNQVELHYLKTDNMLPYIQVEKAAEGRSMSEARERAENIKYHFAFTENKLILDNYFVTPLEDKFRYQTVRIFVYLPEGYVIHADKSTRHYNHSGYSGLYIPYMEESHLYRVADDELKCLDCPVEDDEDESRDGFRLSINNDTINLDDEDIDLNLRINNDSISIKSKGKSIN